MQYRVVVLAVTSIKLLGTMLITEKFIATRVEQVILRFFCGLLVTIASSYEWSKHQPHKSCHGAHRKFQLYCTYS